MNHRTHKDWLKAFLEYSEESETPYKMLYWCGVGAIAGALRRNVRLDQGRYYLYPNFYIILVARAGVIQKSTTINYALNLLKEVPDIFFAPKSCTWEAFVEELEKMHSMNGALDVDATLDKSACITISAPELSTFYDNENKGMVSALTDLWDCPDDFLKVTKFSGRNLIERPCVTLVGGTTPTWMREAFDNFSREGGFASRTIFLHADKKRQFVSRPKRAPEALRKSLIRDLCQISQLRGDFKLTSKAGKEIDEWYHRYHSELEKNPPSVVTGFNDRKQAHILKLAMVMSASRRDDLVIDEELIAEAIAEVDAVEGDFEKAFELLDAREELKAIRLLSEAVQNKGKINKTTLLQQFSRKFTLRELRDAIGVLVESGEVRVVQETSGQYLVYNKAS